MLEIICLSSVICSLYFMFRYDHLKDQYRNVCRERDRLKHKLQTGEEY